MFETLPGFRDFPPEACSRRNHLFRVFRTVARAFDFKEYDAPILEPLDLYVEKSGQEIVGQLFHFEDKGNRPVALRPELTPTLARMVAARANSLAKPIKWFNIGEHFRYERPQKGRGRSFYQFNADLLGESSISADAELISLLISIFETLGLSSNDFKIRLSDRSTWVFLLDGLGVSETARPNVLSAIDKSERRKPEQTIESLNQAVPEHGERLWDEIEQIKKIDSLESLTERLRSVNTSSDSLTLKWEEMISLIRAHGAMDYVSIDLSIVRGLAYYTGFVYEAYEASGEGRALAGGGRYDHLVQKLSNNVDIPACGFAIGDMTLSDCLDSKGLLPQYVLAPDIFLICGDEEKKHGISLVSKIRKAGFSTAYSLKSVAFGKQFKDAGKSGARYALILGKDETISNTIKVKDLRSGKEQSTTQNELVQRLEEFDANGGIQV